MAKYRAYLYRYRTRPSGKKKHPVCGKCGREMILVRDKEYKEYSHYQCFVCGEWVSL